MDLTVLGSSGSHTGPGRVCSGYLVEQAGTRLLLDCGNGSTSNLQRRTAFTDLDAILVTHRHIDHCIDLIGMFYALRFHPHGRQVVDLYAAPGVVDLLTSLLSGDSALEFREVFRCHEIAGGDRLRIGELAIELFPSVHVVPTVSVRLEADGHVLAYSSDSAGGPQLLAVADSADTFLCEATWQGDQADWPPGIHLTATEAGRIASQAGVGRLLLTHVLGSLDPAVTALEAATTYSGPLDVVADGDHYHLT